MVSLLSWNIIAWQFILLTTMFSRNIIAFYHSWYHVSGEVGGYMGLLIGASALTILEIVDLIVYNFFLKCVDHLQRRMSGSRALASTSKATHTSDEMKCCDVNKWGNEYSPIEILKWTTKYFKWWCLRVCRIAKKYARVRVCGTWLHCEMFCFVNLACWISDHL